MDFSESPMKPWQGPSKNLHREGIQSFRVRHGCLRWSRRHACLQHCKVVGNITGSWSPENAGILSAFGIGEAVIERFAEKQVLLPLSQARISELLPDLESEALGKLADEGVDSDQAVIRNRMVFMRFEGQESTIEVNWISEEHLLKDFRSAYTVLYGHWSEGRIIEIESVKVVASATGKSNRYLE